MDLPLDLGQLLLIHLSLSPFTVGGAMTVAPDLHRLLVDERGWLSEADFTRSLTLAQAAPGPNVLYVALAGWLIGWQHAQGGLGAQASLAAAAAATALVGLLLPSSLLACLAAHLAQRWREQALLQAFRRGMEPVVVAAMLGTAVFIGRGAGLGADTPLGLALAAATALAVLRTRWPTWALLAAGALVGALGAA
ncbi:chromate transporter [Ideonella sp. 4Y11]|uniref:Chromate transporter n=1 Tax=Ideonella aquatica TaxID=2824119 RepID=A0A940YNB0_9BURK|nr:chromate transporter [Ideonella aquatica]MBQ0960037.1 chromate transporter [Ideonella aquatica]